MRKKGRYKQRQQQRTNSQPQPAIQTMPAPKQGEPNLTEPQFCKTPPEANAPRAERSRLTVWLPIVFNGLIVIVIITHAYYYKEQRDVMLEQAKLTTRSIEEAQKTRELENRPYVTLNAISFNNTFNSTKPMTLSAHFYNSGKTPALNVQVYPVIGFSRVGSEIEVENTVDSIKKNQSSFDRAGFASSRAILPSERGYDSVIEFTLRDKYKEAIVNGENLHYQGIIEYDDVFGKHWSTEFCLYNASPDTVDFEYCPRHNIFR
jgi:hypothetical protein